MIGDLYEAAVLMLVPNVFVLLCKSRLLYMLLQCQLAIIAAHGLLCKRVLLSVGELNFCLFASELQIILQDRVLV